jgi:hypothetical protein
VERRLPSEAAAGPRAPVPLIGDARIPIGIVGVAAVPSTEGILELLGMRHIGSAPEELLVCGPVHVGITSSMALRLRLLGGCRGGAGGR